MAEGGSVEHSDGWGAQPRLHLEQADTGRETLSKGLSAKLERCIIMVRVVVSEPYWGTQ